MKDRGGASPGGVDSDLPTSFQLNLLILVTQFDNLL